jgi:hypothetical protein
MTKGEGGRKGAARKAMSDAAISGQVHFNETQYADKQGKPAGAILRRPFKALTLSLRFTTSLPTGLPTLSEIDGVFFVVIRRVRRIAPGP